jgi:hypothetical protein
MAKRKASKKDKSVKKKGKSTKRKVPVKTDISSVEEDTIKRANHTITAIEDFLARWDASGIRQEIMVPEVERVKSFHKELVKWQKKALKEHSKSTDKARLKRLHDFVMICRNYS